MNTKQRHQEILAAAAAEIEQRGGVEAIDNLEQQERLATLRAMYKAVETATGCHYDTAKRNVAKALRRARHGVMLARWGGKRPGAGRPHVVRDWLAEGVK